MILKSFNLNNLPNTRLQTKPIIGLNIKSGTIRLNPAAVLRIGAKADDLVEFHQDNDDAENWFIEIVKKDGFQLRKRTTTGSNGLLAQSCSMTRLIFDSMNFPGLSGNISVGAEPVKHEKRLLWPLITAMLTNA